MPILPGASNPTMPHQVVLTWTAAADMPAVIPAGSGYNVYRGTVAGGESTIPLNSAPLTTTTYTDLNITAGVTYFYHVTTILGGSQSVASAEASATVPIFPPTNLIATAS